MMNDNVKRVFAYACAAVLSVSIFFITFFNIIESIAFDIGRYENAYIDMNRAEATGLSLEDLAAVTQGLLDYIKGDRASLDMAADVNGQQRQVFNQRERDHMVDVRNLFAGGYTLRYIFFGAAALSIAGLWYVGMARAIVAWPATWFFTLLGLGAALGAYGLWCAVDFSGAFTAFHRLLFTNDLWILDPSTDIMIMMFPARFFLDMIMAILGKFALYIALITGVACLARQWNKKEEAARGNGL